MKVLFIVPYPTQGPSNRFRVQQYLPALKERGIVSSLRPFYNTAIYKILYKKRNYLKKVFFILFFLFSRVRDILGVKSYDIIFIHREAYPFSGYLFEWLFRLFGKRIIYDFDDSIFLKKPSKIKKVIKMSDTIIAGNEFLKNYACQYNKNVFVLPTCIDTQHYHPKVKLINRDKVIVGWIGTTFTSIYLNLLKDVFEVLAKKYKHIEFRIVGGYFSSGNSRLTCKEWSLESEVGHLQDFDIGVMPLFDDEWAKGKCAFKIIQYMAVGIPTVASRVGMNSQVIQDGIDGFLVDTQIDWINKLSILIESKELRQEMGSNARKKIERLYSINANKEKFIDILEKTYCLK